MTVSFLYPIEKLAKFTRSLGWSALLLPLVLTQAAHAETVTDCPSTVANEEAGQHWSIVLDENEWMYRASLVTGSTLSVSPVEFWIESDGPVDIAVLDWHFPPIYSGRIGVLHYISGAAGTHAMAEFTRIAVIDTLTGELIANPMYSTSVSGARYIEQDDGTTIEENYHYCDLAEIEWLLDKFLMTFDDEQAVYMLPDSGLY